MGKTMSRREFLGIAATAAAGAWLTACQPQVVTQTVEVEKEVVKEVVQTVEVEVAVEKEVVQTVEVTALPPEAIELLVWDQWSGATANVGVELMSTRFMNENPGVTVKRELFAGNEQLRDIIKTALGAGTGPDLLYYDLGAFAMQVLVSADQLLPLDDAYAQYGWDKKFFDFAQKFVTLEGKRYAVPHEYEYEPVYYNKTMYDELGLTVPTTHDEFLANCQVVKDAGYTPIALGNAARGELRHTFGFPVNNLVGYDGMTDIVLCGATWDRPEVTEAIQIICQDYLDFYPPDVNAIPTADGHNLFYIGQAAHKLLGVWFYGTLMDSDFEFEADVFLYPSIHGSEVLPQSWLGSGYEVPTDSKYPDVAIKYIDYLFSVESAKVWVEAVGVMPPMSFDMSGLELTPLAEHTWSMLFDPGQKFGWMPAGFSPPAFYDMMNAGFQLVVAGEKTPEQQTADLQAAWQTSIDEGLYGLKCG